MRRRRSVLLCLTKKVFDKESLHKNVIGKDDYLEANPAEIQWPLELRKHVLEWGSST